MMVVGMISALLVAGIVWAVVDLDAGSREERTAWAWLTRQAPQVPTRSISNSEVSAVGLARVISRPEPGWLPLHFWIWDHLPKSIRTAIGLPRPRGSRWYGLFASTWLGLHEQRQEALPILLAAATDPKRPNRSMVMSFLQKFGTFDPWVEGLAPIKPVEQSILGLQDPNPEVRLQMLRRFASAWPNDRTLRRRMEELQREVGGREFLVTPPVKPGTVPAN